MAKAPWPEPCHAAWLGELADQLAHAGLPADYQARLLEELGDHAEDVFQEEARRMRTDAPDRVSQDNLRARLRQRMGTPEQLAETAATEYRGKRFLDRRPVLGFLVLPPLALVALWASGIALVAFVAQLTKSEQFLAPTQVEHRWEAASAIHLVAVVLPPVLIVALWSRWLARSNRSARWGWAMTLVVALLASMAASQLQFPSAGKRGTLTFGLGMSAHPRVEQFAQFALPLLAGVALVRRAVRSTNRPESAPQPHALA